MKTIILTILTSIVLVFTSCGEQISTENINEVESPASDDKNIEKYVELKLVKVTHKPKNEEYDWDRAEMELMFEAKNLTDKKLESFRFKTQALDESGNYLGKPMSFICSILANSRVTMTESQDAQPSEDLSRVSKLLLMELSIYEESDWWDTQAGNWVLNQSNPYKITLEL